MAFKRKFTEKYYQQAVKPIVNWIGNALNTAEEGTITTILMPYWYYEYYLSYCNEYSLAPYEMVRPYYEKQVFKINAVIILQNHSLIAKRVMSVSEFAE